MSKGRVGEDRGSKETDGCPLIKAMELMQEMLQNMTLDPDCS
jgi:hypothetical protein